MGLATWPWAPEWEPFLRDAHAVGVQLASIPIENRTAVVVLFGAEWLTSDHTPPRGWTPWLKAPDGRATSLRHAADVDMWGRPKGPIPDWPEWLDEGGE